MEPTDNENLFKVNCYCADYDINIPATLSDYTEYPALTCSRNQGFSNHYFFKELEPTIKAIKQWAGEK